MAIYPVEYFTLGNALLGYSDQWQSAPLVQKFGGMPKGVYVGFTPTVASPVLNLVTDPAEGFSLLKTASQDDPGNLTVALDSNVSLDFTGQPPGDFPIHVIARASYTADGSAQTSAEIITRSAGPVAFDETLICVVTGNAGAMTISYRLVLRFGHTHTVELDASLNGTSSTDDGHFHTVVAGVVQTASGHTHPLDMLRDAPLAYDGVEFGFMPAGSVEDLETAVEIVNEMAAARIGLDSTVYDTLSERLEADQSAPSMGGRLGFVLVVLRSNDYLIEAGDTSVNVSGSFSEVNRDHKPEITLDGQGAEGARGAISSPNDDVRNISIVLDATTGYRLLDGIDTRRVIFGRVTGPVEATLTGVYTFSNAQKTVTIAGGQAQGELEEGDTILGADGLYYEIATIFSDELIELADEYQGPNASSGGLTSRRWTLELKKILGVEVDAEADAATTIRFIFPAFVPLETGMADQRLIHHMPGGKPPLPDASTTQPGRVLLSQAGAKLGAINIQNAGSPLAGGPFHTVNFRDGGGQVVETGDGEVTVGEIGQTGPTGDPGVTGAPGPTGPIGDGFTQITPWAGSGWYPSSGYNPGPLNSHSFSAGMGHTIRALCGGFASWDEQNFYSAPFDEIEIIDITGSGTTTGQIDITIAGDTRLKLFLSSAGA